MSAKDTKRNRRVRSYPGHSLEETLRVASAIHRKNAGLPLDRKLLAKELSTTTKSSSFTTILSASKQYGLTEGGYRDQDISLTPLGLSVVASRSSTEKMRSLTIAAYLPSKFKALRDHLQGAPLPAPEFLHGLLTRDLKINSDQSSEYIQIYTANSKFLKRHTNSSASPKTDRPNPYDDPNEENTSPATANTKGLAILVPPQLSSLSTTLERFFSSLNIPIALFNLNAYQVDGFRHSKTTTPFIAATIIPLERHFTQSPEETEKLSSVFLVGLALGITNGPIIILTAKDSGALDLPPIDPGFKAMIHILEYKDDELVQLDLIKLLTNLGILELSVH